VVLAETSCPMLLVGNLYYPHPGPLARRIRNHVPFWNGAQMDAGPASQAHAAPGTG
jgi:hypothetical protein